MIVPELACQNRYLAHEKVITLNRSVWNVIHYNTAGSRGYSYNVHVYNYDIPLALLHVANNSWAYSYVNVFICQVSILMNRCYTNYLTRFRHLLLYICIYVLYTYVFPVLHLYLSYHYCCPYIKNTYFIWHIHNTNTCYVSASVIKNDNCHSVLSFVVH